MITLDFESHEAANNPGPEDGPEPGRVRPLHAQFERLQDELAVEPQLPGVSLAAVLEFSAGIHDRVIIDRGSDR